MDSTKDVITGKKEAQFDLPQIAYTKHGSAEAGPKRIDYVLVYDQPSEQTTSKQANYTDLELNDHAEKQARRRMTFLRQEFECRLVDDGLQLEKEETAKHVYIKVHCPFERLIHEAERLRIEMPLKGPQINVRKSECGLSALTERLFSTDEADFSAYAAFEQSKLERFANCHSKSLFFRPALRSLMVHNILSSTQVSKSLHDEEGMLVGDDQDDEKHGLQYLLVKEAYTDAFILHDECKEDDSDGSLLDDLQSTTANKCSDGSRSSLPKSKLKKRQETQIDERHKLDVLWPKVIAYLPLNRIRNYFGEEISLYFAWSGMLMFSVVFPATFGLAIFCYGLWLSLSKETQTSISSSFAMPGTNDSLVNMATTSNLTTTTAAGYLLSSSTTSVITLVQMLKGYGEDILNTIQWALDNEITPWYSVIICIWGTLYLEAWKRRSAVLSYQWHVCQYEANELMRPQFFGVKWSDPVTGETTLEYPLVKRAAKYVASFSVFLIMVCIVLVISTSMIVYRIVLGINYCSTGIWSGTTCTVVTSLCGTIANAAAIMILGKVYTILAYKLTDWENHKTETAYNDALIIKLFAFLFANSYTSLYYIAFFRGSDSTFGESGILGLGAKYRDNCGDDGNCMSMLSLQVLVLIIMKPLPKVITDVILPWIKKRRICVRTTTVSSQTGITANPFIEFLEKERQKPQLENFTLHEYTEKVIQYGYLMLFAVSMPLAPLIVLLTHVMDRYVDSKRLLWLYRRPVAFIAQDIGVWYNILELLNVCGVITNALLVAFTSSWRLNHLSTLSSKLIFIIAFEHGVFALKYFIALVIPDIPRQVKMAQRQEKYLVEKAMESGRFVKNLASLTTPRYSATNEPVISSLPTSTATNCSSSSKPSSRRKSHSKQKRQRQPTSVYETSEQPNRWTVFTS